jgi:hypothetical protein
LQQRSCHRARARKKCGCEFFRTHQSKKSPVCRKAHGASFAVLEDGSALAANPDRITGLCLGTDRRFWFIGVSALTPDTSK